jgi:hypothetical protein
VSALNQFRHPFDIARHPTLEPEVKRAILASWASDAHAVPSQPGLRRPPGQSGPIPIDDVMSALCSSITLKRGDPGAHATFAVAVRPKCSASSGPGSTGAIPAGRCGFHLS